MDKETLDKIKIAVEGIEKDYGKGSIYKMGDRAVEKVPVIPSGSILLDYALGVGGYPKGRIIEIYGSEGVGKTLLTLTAIAQAQKSGGCCAFIDVEHALDRDWARMLGVDVDNLYVSQPDSGEDALTILERLVEAKSFDVVVVDSVAALVPRSELEGEMGDAHMASQARLMSQAMRKLTGLVGKSNTAVFFLNQTRCIKEDTLILTDKGFKQIKDVIIGEKVITLDNQLVPIKDIVFQESVSGIKINCKHRTPFSIGENHNQPIIKNGEYSLVKAKDIELGDYLIQPILDENNIPEKDHIDLTDIISSIPKSANSKKIELPTLLDEDLAFFMGCYYSDGSMLEKVEKSDYRISFTENSKDRFKIIKDIGVRLFPGLGFYKYPTIRFNGKIFVSFMKALGCKYLGVNKDIPAMIYNSGRSIIKSFLRGCFFDSHGFHKNGFVFTNENLDSTYQFSDLLYNFGIFSDVRDDEKTKKYLYITGEDAINFTRQIGFSEKRKQDLSLKFLSDNTARGKYDIVPYLYGKNIVDKIKKLYGKGLYKLSSFGVICSVCHLRTNFGRKLFIEFLKEVLPFINNNKEISDKLDFIKGNRFTVVQSLEKTIFNSVDVEVPNSLFVASQYLTHNSKIGVVWGNPTCTPGGNALKFYASLRIEVSHGEYIKKGEDIIGHKPKVTIKKNKVAPPFRKCELTLYFLKGIDDEAGVFDLAVTNNIIQKSGSWYSYNDERIGQGQDNSCEFLKNNPKTLEEITRKVKQVLGIIHSDEVKEVEVKKENGQEDQTSEIKTRTRKAKNG